MEMKDELKQYIKDINEITKIGEGTEMSYRSALEKLMSSLLPGNITIINEPKHSTYGVPDLKLYKNKEIAISFIETKSLADTDLEGERQHRKQFDRYKEALSVIAFTDFLHFLLYIDGELKEEAKIAYLGEGRKAILTDDEHELSKFQHIVQQLAEAKPQKITSPSKLSSIMAAKAKLLASVVKNATVNGENDETPNEEDTTLVAQMKAFKKILVHDMDEDQFSDFYAQTIVYGMFIARLNDNEDNFSRLQAFALIPNGYPFLKEIFGIITINGLHSKLVWIIDDLAELFKATNVQETLRNYGKATGRKDPVVHFYEDFLEDYNPKIREQFGVWLTPVQVVSYIVKAVDLLLKNSFNFSKGLAADPVENGEHLLQILDPAIGTGTFHAEVIKEIKSHFKGNEGMWPEYAKDHLVPRLLGFEYLMAPYTMAHLKVASALGLEKLGDNAPQRLNIFLTNSLDKYDHIQTEAFARQVSIEAKAANSIKDSRRVMVVIGNPPYHENSANNSDWIKGLMDDYKQEPGQKQIVKYKKNSLILERVNTLKGEKNSKGLNNDYCKFIRIGQRFVDRTRQGILAYITANTYLDTKMFRGMRYNLLQSFDKIFILNLHGSARRKSNNKDGIKDENVFDIEAGVAIAVFVKLKNHHDENHLAQVFYKDLRGSRKQKFEFLSTHSLEDTSFEEITPTAPYYIMRKRDVSLENVYMQGFSIDELMKVKSQGFKSGKDSISYFFNRNETERFCNDLLKLTPSNFAIRYNISDKKQQEIPMLKRDVEISAWRKNEIQFCYRPFDIRWTIYDHTFIDRPRTLISKHIAGKYNIVLAIGQQGNAIGDKEWSLCYISHIPMDMNVMPRGGAYLFPLYVYKNGFGTPNLSLSIIKEIEKRTGMKFQEDLYENHMNGIFSIDNEDNVDSFGPADIVDYIYAVLNSTKYRTVYHDFLQTAFPVIPYPTDNAYFKDMIELGKRLRVLHTMQDIPESTVRFPTAGDNIVRKREVIDNGNGFLTVNFNDTQSFENVPAEAWNLVISGYQVADEWLKLRQRNEYKLTYDDIEHFEKMIAALKETVKVKGFIDGMVRL